MTVRKDDGTPVAGAIVGAGRQVHGTTDDHGRLALQARSVSTGNYGHHDPWIWAVAAMEDAVWRGVVPRVATGGTRLDVVIRPPEDPGERLQIVRVLGPDGAPVTRFLTRTLRRSTAAEILWSSLEGRDGWACVPVHCTQDRWKPERQMRVYLFGGRTEASGGRSVEFAPVFFTPDPAAGAMVEIRMSAGHRLEGKVVLPDGTPASGVWVKYRPHELTQYEPYDSLDGGYAPESGATTDGAGRFVIEGLSLGGGTATVSPGTAFRGGEPMPAPGVAHFGNGPVSAEVGGTPVVIRLRGLVTARVLVVGADGVPVPGASVRVESENRTIGCPTTGEDGSFELPGLPEGGGVDLLVTAPGFVATRIEGLRVIPEIRVEVSRRATMRVRVIGPDGHVLPWARVGTGRVNSVLEFADDGVAILSELPRGRSVRFAIADGDRRLGATEVVAEDRDLDLYWPAETDRLVVSLSGPRPEAAPLRLAGAGSVRTFRFSSGVFSIPSEGLPETLDLQLGPTLQATYGLARGVPSRGVVRVECHYGRQCAGRVVDFDGKGHAIACVLEGDMGFHHEFDTLHDGTFRVKGLPPGRYTLRAETPTHRGETRLEVPCTDARLVLEAR